MTLLQLEVFLWAVSAVLLSSTALQVYFAWRKPGWMRAMHACASLISGTVAVYVLYSLIYWRWFA